MSANDQKGEEQSSPASATTDQKADVENLETSDEYFNGDAWADDEYNETVPEVDVPIADDRLSTSKNHIRNVADKGSAYAGVGDKAQMHNYNYYIEIVVGAKQYALSDEEDDVTKDDAPSSVRDQIKRALTFERQSGTFPVQKAELGDNRLPSTYEEISKWFYHLNEYEQCYVQAAALLHGATAHEVSKRADKLYLLGRIPHDDLHSLEVRVPGPQLDEHPSYIPLHNRPSKDLQTNTYTTTQRIGGAERLFWLDANQNGLSVFHLRFLDFLAQEYLSKGVHGQDFLNQIQRWAEEIHSDYSWYLARALGVLLWHQNTSELWRIAYYWAKVRGLSRWQRTAMLLDGAYEIDIIKYPEHENDIEASPTLQLLTGWIERTKRMSSLTDINLRSAAANTYALIGKRKIEIALRGLEQLLNIPVPDSGTMQNTNVLQAAVVTAYVTLSWSGYIHCILCYLASTAEQAILQHSLPNKMSQRNQYRMQCQLRLTTSLEAFFLIAADSFSSATTINITAYREPLSNLSSLIPNKERDVLLAGVISPSGKLWHEEVIKLLSAAIIDRNNRSAAFDLLSRWANALANMKGATSSQGNQLIVSFKQFLVYLGQTIDRWCLDLKERGRRPPPASLVYRNRLEQWSKRNNVDEALIQEVLHQLES